ncbi:MAG: helix-turn-helix domain-containing protein [Nitrospira sp.]|nr:helix-turn-helix domain-containing protein [Nitrospira sp.]
MESIGDFFRQVRETKGLTLDDVASKTRIHPEFLMALEEGNYARLPDQVFAKGFVRSYARSLGLDEEEAMRRFADSAGSFYSKQSELELLRVRQVADERQRQANRKVIFAAAAVAVLALILLLGREQSTMTRHRPAVEAEPPAAPAGPAGPATGALRGQSERKPSDSAPVRRGPERTEAGPPAATEPKPQEAAPVLGAPTVSQEASLSLPTVPTSPLAGLPGQTEPARSGALVLDLEALELSWVVVQIDGASPHEALMRPGDRVQWKASDRFTLTLGNAGGVRGSLNGKPLDPFGPRGRVARDIVLKRP